MTDTAILRVAISQCVIFAILLYVFILLGVTLDDNGADQYNLSRAGLFVMSGYLFIPLAFSFLLLFSVIKKKLVLVRTWIAATIVNAIILFCILMSEAVRASSRANVSWTIILIAAPILLTMWIFDHVIVVLDSYKKSEYQRKKDNIKTIMAAGISYA
ncbi:hypothetical protein FQR65_LT10860 [Abscondita terminalis]|nr:hypothetical protein FQR65_LT10860 [Abscondita terminalis]